MRLRYLSAMAAMAFLAACSNSPSGSTDTGANGLNIQPPGGAGVGGGSVDSSGLSGQQGQGIFGAQDRVYFDVDHSDITSDGQATLAAQAQIMRQNPSQTFTISGNCDERGTREYNLALGERRATAVRNALVSLGIDASRLKTVSYGKEQPSVAGHDEDAWAKNRNAITSVGGVSQ